MLDILDHESLEAVLTWNALITQLRDWFVENKVQSPERQICTICAPNGDEASLLIMPAWVPGKAIGLKAVTYFPNNASKGLPTISAGYMYFDGDTGQLQSVMDGDTLTVRRTAATSALAADFLARKRAKRHLIVGTGQLAKAVAEAHSTVRVFDRVQIWGRSISKSESIARSLNQLGLPAEPVDDLITACNEADVISTVTASTQSLLKGEWIQAGTHLDLIGSFRSDMRETDDLAIQQATLFVDTPEEAKKAGDLAAPMAAGLIDDSHIKATLSELCQDKHSGRASDDERTAFKSVGMALEDLAAADMVYKH